jgi:hypothetical protein
MKRTLLSLTLLAALLTAAAPAGAKRAPTGTEKRAITAAFERYLHASGSPAAPDSHVTRITVSTKRAGWARANFTSTSAGPAMAALRVRGGRWRVLNIGSAFVQCDVGMPKPVQKELFGFDDCPPEGR